MKHVDVILEVGVVIGLYAIFLRLIYQGLTAGTQLLLKMLGVG